MTLHEFIKKYEGKFVDVDGFPKDNPYQCVDLYRQYVKEVLGYPQSPPVEGAKDIWNSYLPEYFTRVENTPDGVPQKGDIIIFGTGLGRWGHVSIFLEGNINRFTSLDQNYPSGSPVHKQGHTYSAVIGWLTPINDIIKPPVEITDKTKIPQITDDNGNPMEVQAIRSRLNDLNRDLISAQTNLNIANAKVKAFADQNETFIKELETQKTTIITLTKARNDAQEKAAELQEEINHGLKLGPFGKLGRSIDEALKLV